MIVFPRWLANCREQRGYLEGMSVVNINKQRVQEWLKTFRVC